jgi:hypothetical protein
MHWRRSLLGKLMHFQTPSCGIIRPINPVAPNVSTSPAPEAQQEVTVRPRRHFLGTALWVAALANVLIPAVLFSATRFFGPTDLRYRALVASVVLAEYVIAFLLFLLHANVGFAAGYTFATAATVTLGSSVLAFITLAPARWSWGAFASELFVLGGFAFALISNVVFLVASIRYARAIHPRLHIGGFFLGIVAFIALVVLYSRTVT